MFNHLQPDSLDDFDSDAGRRSFPGIGKLLAGVAVLFLVLWVGKGLMEPVANAASLLRSRPELVLIGDSVGNLEPGARVMLGNVTIGEVRECGVEHGRAMARLQLEERWMDQMTVQHRFEVRSLNVWLPGNIGVRVFPPSTTSGPPAALLARGAEVVVTESALPTQFPQLFYLLCGAGMLVLVIIIVAGRKAGAGLFKLVLIAGIVFGAWWLATHGGQVEQLIREHQFDQIDSGSVPSATETFNASPSE